MTFCWHKWSKWGPMQEAIAGRQLDYGGYYAIIQVRMCEKCGQAQTRQVDNLRGVPK